MQLRYEDKSHSFRRRFHWEEYLTVLANTLARIEAIQDHSTTSDALKALMGTILVTRSQQDYQHH